LFELKWSVTISLLALFLISYASSRFLTRQTIILALKKRIVAYPSARSSHSVPTPRIGGIGLCIPFLIIALALHLVVSLLYSRNSIAANDLRFPLPPHAASFFGLPYLAFDKSFWIALSVVGGGIFFVGLLDDLRELKPRQKLALQCIFAALTLLLGFGLTAISVPLLGRLKLGVLGLLLSFFWILFSMNAYNFMDGMDGIAGSFAIYVSAFLLFIFEVGQLWVTDLLPVLVVLIGCCAGFLAYNRSPAKTFLGDCGSQFLGYFFALVALALNRYDQRAFMIVVLLMLPFLYDVTFTLIRRALRRENLLEAHHSHLYQRLLEIGYSHKSVLEIVEITFVLCGLAVYFYCKVPQQPLRIVFAALAFLVLFFYTAFVKRQEKRIGETPPH
jgi:UDP-N-acetylmuramyl pentapeptide phosphotransferase/UDP-N-acetylglucosamine-1-phosphate transferase